jgi:hypothetical protein
MRSINDSEFPGIKGDSGCSTVLLSGDPKPKGKVQVIAAEHAGNGSFSCEMRIVVRLLTFVY